MTKAQEIYAETLNLLGSDPGVPSEIQVILDNEHAKASPDFASVLAERAKAALAS